MAEIDPITGLPTSTSEQVQALGGGKNVQVDSSLNNYGPDAMSNYSTPPDDLGRGDLTAALKGSAEDKTAALMDATEDVNSNLAPYQQPGESELNTIKGYDEYYDPSMLVSTQLSKLIDPESEYMKAVDIRSREESNKYGGLGSAQAIGAGRRNAIEAALPIAQGDADVKTRFGLQEQAAANEVNKLTAETALGSALMVQRMALENQQKSLDNAFQLASLSLDQEGQLALTDLSARWKMVADEANMNLEAALQQKLTQHKIDAEMVASVKKSAGDMIQSYQISVEELLKDPDFLQLGGSAISKTINNMLKTTVAGIQFMADSSGINLDDYLDDFEKNARMGVTIPEP
jgi:hypothetical protein